MKRSLLPNIRKDLEQKIILLSGPRQSGKTTLSKMITDSFDYFNYDYPEHRADLLEMSWDRQKDLVIFDELHKLPKWKSWIKGVYDVEGIPPRYLVTGSANLSTAGKAGDSLAGRHFLYRLHPFDLKEVSTEIAPEDALERVLRVGGFPEPFLQNDDTFYRRWKRSHTDTILRQDLLDLESVTDIMSIETLIELLRRRVGSTVSYSSLARDLSRDPKTVKQWIQHLETLYVLFPVRPYSHKISRSLRKEPKYYLFDTAQVSSGEGAQIENLVACALLKELHRIEDTQGYSTALHFLRTKEGKEVDFAVVIEEDVRYLIEVKTGDSSPHKPLEHFGSLFPNAVKLQLVKNLTKEKTYPKGIQIRRVSDWLAQLQLV